MTTGLGGIFVELLSDTKMCLLLASDAAMRQAWLLLKGAEFLNGFRGAPWVDMAALLKATSAIARAALGLKLAGLEVNPLYAKGSSVEALDAVVIRSDPLEDRKRSS